jgi:hypothetical protein
MKNFPILFGAVIFSYCISLFCYTVKIPEEISVFVGILFLLFIMIKVIADELNVNKTVLQNE